jgi:formate/nitrite transporter FocA (FNT family)
VILAIGARTITGKILGVFFPISVFVLSGFEHSIANMYFLPAGLLARGELLTAFHTMFYNLIPVTVGNVIGGLAVILMHPKRARQIALSVRRTTDAGGTDKKERS